MQVAQQEKNGVSIFHIRGEINIDNVSGLKKIFQELIDKKPGGVLLNFSQVGYIDSMGISSLIELAKKLREVEGQLAFCDLSPKIRSIFSITRIDKMFNLYDSEQEALRGFRPGRA